VEAQQDNPHSLLWWMKHVIEQRKQFKAFGRGTLEFLRPSNRKVLAYYRRYQNENILVVANLSRFPQHVELDLAQSKGMTPVEIFGRTEFPPIGDQPYLLTLGALSFYWLSLESRQVRQESVPSQESQPGIPPPGIPLVAVNSFDEVFQGRSLAVLLRMLPDFLKTRRWFLGKNRAIRSIDILDTLTIGDTASQILLARIEYGEGDPEIYVLPGSVASGDAGEQVKSKLSDVSVMRLREPGGQEGILYSAVWNPAFSDALLGAIARRRRFRGRFGELAGSHTRVFRKVWGERHPDLAPTVLTAEQSNTSIVFGDRFILKMYRRIEPGVHPEIEMGAFLTERNFPYAAPLTGSIEYHSHLNDSMSVAVLHGFVQNQGNASRYTLDALSQFFESALTRHESEHTTPEQNHPLELLRAEFPQPVHELIGTYVDSAGLLGRRTAELHQALNSEKIDPLFAPEPFTDHARQAFYHGMLGLTTQTVQLLRQQLPTLPAAAQEEARKLLEKEDQIRLFFRPVPERRVPAARIRLHDDLRLEQILYTGKDFIFVGFGGRADRPLSERRIKRPPLRDVAGLLLSFEYAAHAVLFDQVPGVTSRPETAPSLAFWAGYWRDWVSAMFLKSYLETVDAKALLLENDADVRLLLNVFLMERALEELGRELMERPAWAVVPIRLILRLLG
jgi:maltose alpha-D-glucosyltransferase/alpha-amylase